MTRTPKKAPAKVANGKARMVFYGMRTVHCGRTPDSVRFTRHYVAVETPDVVVRVSLEVPDRWYEAKERIDIDETMNDMAKQYYPKADIFMFYNRVTARGIIAPQPEPPCKSKFVVEKSITKLL